PTSREQLFAGSPPLGHGNCGALTDWQDPAEKQNGSRRSHRARPRILIRLMASQNSTPFNESERPTERRYFGAPHCARAACNFVLMAFDGLSAFASSSAARTLPQSFSSNDAAPR